ncbi:MAG TPA: YlxR family protein [Myxococcales bacterium]|nr:YlxR family protein [Myxococcales bacterium]
MVRGRRAGRIRPNEPQRRCVVCKVVRPQRELLRLSVQGEEVVPGPGPGRGCYICRTPECARKAVEKRQIARALKGRASGPQLDRLLRWLA